MRRILVILLGLAITLGPVLYVGAPAAQAQATPPDCSFAFSFTAAGAQVSRANLSGSTNTPCIAWRVTYNSTGTLSATVQFETSPDNITFTAVTNTICSSTVQPPCITDGSNPMATGPQGSVALRAYGAYIRVNVTAKTGSGTGTIKVYGYKGTSASSSTGGGGGGSGPSGPSGPGGATGPTGPSGAAGSGATGPTGPSGASGGSGLSQANSLSGGSIGTDIQRIVDGKFVTFTQGSTLTLSGTAPQSVTIATGVSCLVTWVYARVTLTTQFTGGTGGLFMTIQHNGADLVAHYDMTATSGQLYPDIPAGVCSGASTATLAAVFNGDGINNMNLYTAGAVLIEIGGFKAQ